MATTPPPPSFIRTPPTPRHGPLSDEYQPFAPRHSARLAERKGSKESRTTPPSALDLQALAAPSTAKRSKKSRAFSALSPPPSSASTPRKRGRTAGYLASEHHVTGDTPIMAAVMNPSDLTGRVENFSSATGVSMSNNMLPTPAKTPRKKAVDEMGGTARVLFAHSATANDHEIMPGKKTRKYNGFSLESFEESSGGDSAQIAIFTDSRDKVPEVDSNADNPFNANAKSSGPETKAKAKKTGNRGRDPDVQASMKRDDGMYYIFRGKKYFKKFDPESDDDGSDLGLLAARPDLRTESSPTRGRPFTRSSIKPRILFPHAHQRSEGTVNQRSENDVTDEESATDVEDPSMSDGDTVTRERDVTPPPKYEFATPAAPRTGRSLRQQGFVPVTKERSVPFTGWKRAKSATRKREAEADSESRHVSSSEGSEPASKRTRDS